MEFYKLLQESRNEKDVENSYREYFKSELKKNKYTSNAIFISPYNTDGYLKMPGRMHKLNCLFEFKYDVKFANKIERTRVIIQSLYYLKKFELGGEFYIPTMLFIGDKNECFYLHTNKIKKYLDYDLDWSISPSDSGKKNDSLLREMVEDPNLEYLHITDIDENFNFTDMLKHIVGLSTGTDSRYKITKQNAHKILRVFLKKVLKHKGLSVNDQVNLFIQSLVDRKNNSTLTNNPNILWTKGFGAIKIDGQAYKSYVKHFETELTPKEKEALTATQDRLIQDETRRRQGEFFTPTVWVDEAHKMISETLGEDWKDSVVWDNSSGTGNLTRDYLDFKELYCSTLIGSDIETMEQSKYNTGAVKFQYDFLNDGIIDGKIDIKNDPKLPDGLKNAILEGKKITFLINPPYGTANDAGAKGTHKGGMSLTKTNELMKIEDWGSASQQLYAQFLYKITKLQEINKNINICLFSPPLLLSGSSYKKFRNKFFQKFDFKYGFLMNASEFQDTSDWGLSFSIWTPGECVNKENFNYTIKKNTDLQIVNTQTKNIYNLDNKISFSDFIKRNIKKEKSFDAPQMSSALKIQDKKGRGSICNNSLGCYVNQSNNIFENTSGVFIVSSAAYKGNCISILPINFMDVVSNFTSRKLISSNWMNQKDEYMALTEAIQQTPEYIQFNNDAIVYSLFNTSSNQSSMRQVEYKDKLWNIKNEFFWMSRNEMIELADEHRFDELYKDAKKYDDRYVYNLLKTTQLSPDAQELLEMSKELIRKSFEWRKIMHTTNPEYHLDAWDAGWYQIKKVLNDHFKEDLSQFNYKYKKFEERMRPQVYHLGFLNDDNRDYDVEYQKQIRQEKLDSLPEDVLEF